MANITRDVDTGLKLTPHYGCNSTRVKQSAGYYASVGKSTRLSWCFASCCATN